MSQLVGEHLLGARRIVVEPAARPVLDDDVRFPDGERRRGVGREPGAARAQDAVAVAGRGAGEAPRQVVVGVAGQQGVAAVGMLEAGGEAAGAVVDVADVGARVRVPRLHRHLELVGAEIGEPGLAGLVHRPVDGRAAVELEPALLHPAEVVELLLHLAEVGGRQLELVVRRPLLTAGAVGQPLGEPRVVAHLHGAGGEAAAGVHRLHLRQVAHRHRLAFGAGRGDLVEHADRQVERPEGPVRVRDEEEQDGLAGAQLGRSPDLERQPVRPGTAEHPQPQRAAGDAALEDALDQQPVVGRGHAGGERRRLLRDHLGLGHAPRLVGELGVGAEHDRGGGEPPRRGQGGRGDERKEQEERESEPGRHACDQPVGKCHGTGVGEHRESRRRSYAARITGEVTYVTAPG